jgi:hypothetical protein
LAFFESPQKMVAGTDINISSTSRRVNYFNPGIGAGSVYLCNFLIVMVKKEKIEVEKKKKRIPVPKKPPKVEESKKAYDRKKEKEKIKKIIRGDK